MYHLSLLIFGLILFVIPFCPTLGIIILLIIILLLFEE
jgi:hypothetical protein